MMRCSRQTLLAVVIPTFLAAACSGSDDNNANEDVNHENHANHSTENNASTPDDMGTSTEEDMSPADEEDSAPDVDQGTPEEDMGAPIEEDMNPPEEDMGVDMAEECDPQAVSASLVAVHTDASTTETATFTSLEAEGAWRLELDAALGGAAAASEASFLYVDLENGELLELSDAEAFTDDRWDIAFKRTEIRINSEDSGPGSWILADVEAESFEAAAPPSPQEGMWRGDDFVSETCEVATFGRGTIETAFGQWYDYDPSTHMVSAPEGKVYFLYDAATHAVIKLQIESYADAIYTLRWE